MLNAGRGQDILSKYQESLGLVLCHARLVSPAASETAIAADTLLLAPLDNLEKPIVSTGLPSHAVYSRKVKKEDPDVPIPVASEVGIRKTPLGPA
jgi:hypothetical protein